MATSGARPPRVPVRIDPDVWREEVERLAPTSDARVRAERERQAMERDGVERTEIQRCTDEGADRTVLRGQLKVYVPLGLASLSDRPYGFVFSPTALDSGELGLRLVAFGERHPGRAATRSVYERAHRRLHGRYPPA